MTALDAKTQLVVLAALGLAIGLLYNHFLETAGTPSATLPQSLVEGCYRGDGTIAVVGRKTVRFSGKYELQSALGPLSVSNGHYYLEMKAAGASLPVHPYLPVTFDGTRVTALVPTLSDYTSQTLRLGDCR